MVHKSTEYKHLKSKGEREMNAQRQTFDCSLKALWPYNRRYHNRSAKVIHIQFIHVYIIIYIYKMTKVVRALYKIIYQKSKLLVSLNFLTNWKYTSYSMWKWYTLFVVSCRVCINYHQLPYTVKIAVAEGKVKCVADNKLLTRILLSWYGTKTT